MNNLNFKNYPSRILVTIICFIIALNFGLHAVIQLLTGKEDMNILNHVLSITTTSTLVILILRSVNKYGMWPAYLKLLNHCDVRGNYVGIITSSFHIQDNPGFPHIKLYASFKIAQNLNGFRIDGRFYTDEACEHLSSEFSSSDGEIQKQDNGTFRMFYFYSSKGSQFHSDQQRYGLTNHDGVCVLTFDPVTSRFDGYYYTHERSSHGTLNLKKV